MALDLDAATRFGHALSPEDRIVVPCYAALTDAMAKDELACALLDAAPVSQQNPTLVLAALHDAALLGHPVLAPLYQRLNDDEDSPTPVAFAKAVLAVLHEEPTIVSSRLDRRTQTNEINRSGSIAAVLAALRAHGVSDISLVDAGCSMGLNLYPDFQRYREVDDGDDATIVTELRGDATFGPLPTIHERVGIDLAPLDPANPQDVAWLRACIWPEQRRRAHRLAAALAALPSWPPAVRLTGSVVDHLETALARCPEKSTPVLLHSWMAAYLSTDEQVALRDLVRRQTRPLVWVALEHPLLVPGLQPPPDPSDKDARHAGATHIMVSINGGDLQHWGHSHAHGRWVELSPSGPKA